MEKRTKLSADTLKARNDRFNKLSPKRKMVEIQKDILKMLDSKAYIPARSLGYISSIGLFPDRPTGQQRMLLEKPIECEVCARGAIVLSRIRLGNKHNLLHSKSTINDVPSSYLSILEILFEDYTAGWDDMFELSLDDGENERLRDIAEKKAIALNKMIASYSKKSDTQAIRAMAKNIIENKGDLFFGGVNITELTWQTWKPSLVSRSTLALVW